MHCRADCGWTYALVTLSLLAVKLSAGQKCLSQRLEDVVIDIQLSLARGIRGNEPTHTASQEDCLGSCCSTKNIAGDKACNLMIFDARKADGQPNCYLFFCPGEASCPLKPAVVGLSTHRVFPAAVPHQDFTTHDGVPGLASVTPSPQGLTHPPGRGTSSQRLEATGHWQQLLQTDLWGTRVPEGHSQRPPLSSSPATAHRAPLAPSLAAPSPPAAPAPVTSLHGGSPTPEPAVPQPSHAPGTPQASPVPSQTPTAPVSTDLPPTVSSRVLPSTRFQAPTEVQGTQEAEAVGATSRSAPGPATITTTAWSHGEARGYSSPPVGAQRSQSGLPFERWLLLGALLCGVLLLALGLLVLGRALLQALRTRPYSRLDYLINGVYVGI